MLKENNIKDQIAVWLQLIFVFFLPSWQQVSVVSLILLLVFSLFTGKVGESLSLFRRDKLLWFLVAFYLVHVLGIAYSDNLNYGFFDLQVKLSFLLIPLFLSVTLLKGVSLLKIKWSFIAGNILAAMVCLFLAIMKFSLDGQTNHFFYVDYSYFLHTTYFSMYLNIAVIFLLDEWLKGESQRNPTYRLIPLLILFLLFTIILLFARTALATAFVSIPVFLLLKRRDWIRVRSKVLTLMAMAILLSGIQFSAFHYSNRFVQVEQVMEHSSETWNEDRLKTETVVAEDNSTSTRIRLWKNALQLISMHPLLGVGTGDIKDELKSEYALNNYRYGVDGDLNPHNQYLHTTVMLGLFGLLFLLIFLFMPAFEALKFRNWTYATFLLIIILNAFTESIMEVQKGILFIVYFQVLLYLHMKYDGRLEPVNTPH